MLLSNNRSDYIQELSKKYPYNDKVKFVSKIIFSGASFISDEMFWCKSLNELIIFVQHFDDSLLIGSLKPIEWDSISMHRTKYLDKDTFDKVYYTYSNYILKNFCHECGRKPDWFSFEVLSPGNRFVLETRRDLLCQGDAAANYVSYLKLLQVRPTFDSDTNTAICPNSKINYSIGIGLCEKEFMIPHFWFNTKHSKQILQISNELYLKLSHTFTLDEIVVNGLEKFEIAYGLFQTEFELLPYKELYVDINGNNVDVYILINLSQLTESEWYEMYAIPNYY